jgi:hypothetical protein
MDGLSVAANVVAVVDLAAKVATLCFQYSKAVIGARADIARLRGQIQRLDLVLEHTRRLIECTSGQRLVASQEVVKSLQEFKADLKMLQTRLEPDPRRKAMHRFGIRALKWPFSSQEIEGVVSRFERYEQTINSGLQIDQTYA